MNCQTECNIPTSVKEVQKLGWDYIDVIFFTGDAFVDHPSFGTACIARWLQKHGYRVAVVPQPNWRDDLRDFRKLGAPRLYFAVNSGAMDSMVNHYTAARRLRHNDAYTPDGRAGQRPDYAVTVYSQILKRLYPEVPVVIGGIEASLRRLTHYDYWQNKLLPSILVSSGADWLCYGMGEKPMLELTRAIEAGRNRHQIESIPQIAFFRTGKLSGASPGEFRRTVATRGLVNGRGPQGISNCIGDDAAGGMSGAKLGEVLPAVAPLVVLHSYEECCADKKAFAENFHLIETNANMMHPAVLAEPCGDGYVQVNPPCPPSTTEEMDSYWDLPFTRLPHQRYAGKRIPAYDMIKDSIITHRGCFGGCSFCTIAAHQGKFIQSRSEQSIVDEVRKLAAMPQFRGNISDLGAPTANMYGMRGTDSSRCEICRRKSCLFPAPCSNLDRSHERVLELYRKVMAVKGIRHAYVGSGVRYDLFLNPDGFVDESGRRYLRSLILEHTSGRLKVAPEHTEKKVLDIMAKPSFELFERLKKEFDKINREAGTHVELVPYFISSHPGCTMEDMNRLSRNKTLRGVWMEQVQDFTPTPMTASSVMFWTGINPATMKPVFVERNPSEKAAQKSKFFKK
ncbi:MAG: YgiQ family radical SAM protein [Bacteroidales bacterium]|nr:YgiQ family radical SAM protein [Bacteroidales bacterium]